MQEKISDYPDLVKVNRAYVVNVNDHEYNAAKMRQKTQRTMQSLESRVAAIETTLGEILNLLKEGRKL